MELQKYEKYRSSGSSKSSFPWREHSKKLKCFCNLISLGLLVHLNNEASKILKIV